MIGRTVSRYRILQKIGAGGMGEVYLAEDAELSRRVAIKFLPGSSAPDADVLARFKREARAAAALDHPNIITIHEVGDHEGRPFIVMTYVEGEPLSAAIANGPLALDRTLDHGIQIADALAKAHHAGVVHRDIKPENILIDTDGHVRILDFGLAKLHGATKLTREASTLGTIYYMSPEQAKSADVDGRSDIFSLGAVLYEMITGQPPFRGDHPAAVVYAITSEDPEPLARFSRHVSPELQRIVSKALAKNPDERYQSALDLTADLRRERRDASTAALEPAARGRRALKIIIPSSLLVAAVALLLILKPFKFEVAPDHPVAAADNLMAVMYFDNLADSEDTKRLGEIITNLLITDLSESGNLNVLSSQRLYDLIKLEGKEGVRALDRGTSTDVAREAGAKWMLLGSILQVEPAIVVTSQVVEVATGAVVSSQRVTSEGEAGVFDVADKLSGEIRSDMSIPSRSRDAPATRTTESEEAYRYYLEGLEYDEKLYRDKAKESYLDALAFDSTFAMAYWRLSIPPALTSREEKMAYADKAYRFRDHANEQDRMLIDAGYAYLHTGPGEGIRIMESMVERYPDDKQAYFVLANVTWEHTHDAEIAIRYMRRAIEIDPLYRGAYNALAYWYDNVGDLDQSIWAINKYIEIAPDEPNPYDTRGELYANNGKLDEAIASYKVALEKDPEYSWSRARLGHLLRAKGDYAAAEACYRRLLEAQPPMRSRARMYLACLSVYQGKLARGLEQLEQGLAADEIEDLRLDGYNDKLIAKARISEMKGNSAEALATIARLPRYETGSQEGWDGVYCEFLARSGDLEGAQRAANALRQALDRGHRFEEDYWYAKGWIEFEQGRYDKAADHFARATRIKPVFWNRFMLARAYLNSDRLAEATEMFDRTLNRYDEGWAVEPIWAATIHYYAGIASERSGWKDRATQHYQEFLSIWKDADPGIDLVDDAKQRLERLRRGT